MRRLLIALASLAALSPAAALADETWLYCGAKNETTGAIAVSTPFEGQLDYLDSYGRQFATYLASVGFLPTAAAPAICAWAPDQAGAAAEVRALTTLGPDDDPALKFVSLEWRGQPIGPRTSFDLDPAVQALNREISARNAAAQAREEAANARHQAAMAAFEAQQKAYREAVVATEAEAARRKAQYDADRAAWQAQVAACKGGDRSACAKE